MDSRIGIGANASYENGYFQFISMKGKLGMVLAAVSQRGLSALLFGDDREELERDLRREFPDEQPVSGGYGLEGIGSSIVSFTEDPRIGVSLPLDVRARPFRSASGKNFDPSLPANNARIPKSPGG
jgi:AraC family transcriptional regulator of adaptative response/methylated-DNA-[protein]-cysteine methyltransferase